MNATIKRLLGLVSPIIKLYQGSLDKDEIAVYEVFTGTDVDSEDEPIDTVTITFKFVDELHWQFLEPLAKLLAPKKNVHWSIRSNEIMDGIKTISIDLW